MANNNDGQIVLGLDIPKTVSQINDDIKKLEKQLEQVKATGALDTDKTLKQLNAQIKSLQAQLKTIEIKATVDPKSIQKTGQQIGSQIKNATKGSSVASEILNASDLDKQGKTYILKVSNTIEATKKEIQSKLRNSGYFDIEIKGVEKANGQIKSVTVNATNAKGVLEQLNFERAKMQKGGKVTNALVQTDDVKVLGTLSSSIDKVHGNLSTLKTKWEEQGVLVGDFKTKVEQLENSLASVGSKGELNGLESQIKTLKAEASQIAEVNKIQHSLDVGDYDVEYKSFETSLKKLGFSGDELENKLKGVKTTLDDLKASATKTEVIPDDVIENARLLDIEIEKISNDIKTIKLDNSLFADDIKVNDTITRLNEQLRKNTAYSTEAKHKIQDWINELKKGDVAEARLKSINSEAKELHAEMAKLGKIGKSFTQTIKEGAKSFLEWTISSVSVMEVINGFRQLTNAVYDIDTAMTNLYKVTDETDARYNKFLESACDNAQRLGRSVSSLVEQTANWSKLGFSLDEAEKLAEVSSIYANVAEVSDDTAVSDLVTAMKAFNIEASEAITIADRLNLLGNKYATSAADLGTGLANSASALALAGNDIDETLAMITAMTEVTQDASESGNALKILSMRLRGMKGELEALGEESDNIESISKIQTQILNLTGGKVNIFDNVGNFKSTYEIMKGISEVWTEISQTNQAELLEIIAGKQRGNSISALLTNMSQANNALNDSINSSGSAYEEQERWMKSLEAKTQRFEAAFQSLSNTLLDSDLLGFFVDFGTGAVNSLDTVIDKFGTLDTLATIGSGIAGATGHGLTNYVT